MSRRKEDAIETAEPHFRGKCQTSLKLEDIDAGLKESIKKMYTSFIEYQRQGSNWTVDKVVDLTIHMARYRPLKGSSYIPLPIKLRSKHAIINVKNKDSKCFMWSILAALNPAKRDAERVWKYKEHTSSLNFDTIMFPVKLADIPKFEKQNEISINVFGFNKGEQENVIRREKKTTKHIPCGFAYKVDGLTPEKSNEPVVYRGADAADKFVECMVNEQEEIEQRFKHCEPMIMTGIHLSGEGITTLDYAHAQHVWQLFNIQNLGQYHDLYVLSDVLALADVFENFREICLNYYGLDAAHFYTSPGLAWQAALKMTGVKLELLTDIDMHLFIEKGLRGGISMISHRHAKANNKHVPNYDQNQPINHVMYLDANNLYGWAMSQALPVEGFRWLNDSEIENLNIGDIADDSENGYILEVDLEYPRGLHDDHNEYPLAPEK
ncbi:Hypothetical predicted protein [Mytilus galloprovincialis]|uniref:DNA-directed DNA polymerase n=1 Tax=Mytilus galloprovincialis TaxID=29158 RepID=A0A8B6ERQ6_MYTGA|nr:Hypothetical predicted protein [Mytilus galloprovincialis]